MSNQKHLLGDYACRFLNDELTDDRNLSANTRKSYGDTIWLLFRYIQDQRGTDAIRVRVEQVDAALVRDFLRHLEQVRGNSIATRNLRLAALHSLFRFIGRQAPELVAQAIEINDIPMRRGPIPVMGYLEKNEMDALLATPDRSRAQGRRDYALLLFLYNSGARASEAAGVRIADLEPDNRSVRLYGKGRKSRICPLWKSTVEVLVELLGSRINGSRDKPVFLNVQGRPITRFGIHNLILRSASRAAEIVPSLQHRRVTPHTIRHTTAVHLLQAGIDINTIRAWLGHVSLETTNRYAEVNLEMKAQALELCAVHDANPATDGAANWQSDGDLMTFLTSL